jgi:hypothetical protein
VFHKSLRLAQVFQSVLYASFEHNIHFIHMIFIKFMRFPISLSFVVLKQLKFWGGVTCSIIKIIFTPTSKNSSSQNLNYTIN